MGVGPRRPQRLNRAPTARNARLRNRRHAQRWVPQTDQGRRRQSRSVGATSSGIATGSSRYARLELAGERARVGAVLCVGGMTVGSMFWAASCVTESRLRDASSACRNSL